MNNKSNKTLECSHCKKQNDEMSNFCKFCGEPLNELAKDLLKEKVTTAQLLLLSDLANKIEDQNSLNLIKKVISKLDN